MAEKHLAAANRLFKQTEPALSSSHGTSITLNRGTGSWTSPLLQISRIMLTALPLPFFVKQAQGLIIVIARELQSHLNRICVNGAIPVIGINS
jgi:hypothetical protein